MDPNSNQASGLGLPPPPPGGDSFVPINPAQDTASPATQPLPVTQPVLNEQADDGNEVLDQDWVDKAKDIVEKTKSDPFTESRELSKIRADFLKSRYNKQIKAHEDNA